MKNETKKLLITALAIIVPIACFIAYGFLIIYREDKQLERAPEYTNAIIIDTYVGAKVKEYVKYKFDVNGETFVGHQQYYPKIETIHIGDTIDVVYAKTNPEISELLVTENKTLRKKR